MRLVGQSVEQGRRQVRISEDLGPAAESEVRRHDDRSALVPFREDLEQQLSSFLRKGNVAQFVHYEQVVPGVLAQSTGKRLFPPAFQKFVDEIAGRGKTDPQIQPAGFYSQGCGEMGLAAPAFALEKDVPASGDVVSGGQFTDESPVELRRLFEGEGRLRFDQWETGFFQPSLLPVLGADPEFQVRELQEELFVARSPFRGLAKTFLKVPGGIAQGEALQVFMKLQEEGRIHRPPREGRSTARTREGESFPPAFRPTRGGGGFRRRCPVRFPGHAPPPLPPSFARMS